MKEVVVLGGGFGGVAAVSAMRKYTKELHITLVDKNPYHLFTPSLYEVATSEEPQQNVAIPLSEIFQKNVTIITDTVLEIRAHEGKIILEKNNEINFDYLIIALGSESSDFGIPGLKACSVPLKTVDDAMMIRNKIKSMCCTEGKCNRKVSVIIGGGGFSGTEFAAELLTYKDRIAKQNHLAPDCLDISVIQGSDRLLKELDPKVSAIAQKRVASPMMHLLFGEHIKEVTKDVIITDKGNTYPYSIFVWTGGVKANELLQKNGLTQDKSGRASVNNFLQIAGFENIFAIGDVALFTNPKTNQLAPGVAQVAQDQGKIAGENVGRLVLGKILLPYSFHHLGYVVPLRNKYAAAQLLFGIIVTGFLGYIIQQLVVLYYFLKILPLPKAMMRWNTFEMQLMEN